MKICLIVVTHNGQQWISSCLDSVLQSRASLDVIIVDNASADNTTEIIVDNFPQFHLIRLQQNKGFGAANNIGLCEAMDRKADYVFLLNQDARIIATTVEILVRAAENHPEYGILSPLHYAPDGKSLDFFFYRYLPKHVKHLFSTPDQARRLDEVYTVPFVNAALWLMPTRILKKTGLFDPIFFQYGEDNDLIHRIHFAGFKVGICPQAVGFHDRDQHYIREKTSNVSRNKSEAGYKVALLNPNDPYLLSCMKTSAMALRNLLEAMLSSPSCLLRELGIVRQIYRNRRQLKELRKGRITSYQP
jgi:GT2 family glycosyltransferase